MRCVCYLVLRKSLIYLLVLTPIRFSSDFRIHCRLRRFSSSSQSFHHPCLYPFILPPYFSPSEKPTRPHILPFIPSQKGRKEIENRKKNCLEFFLFPIICLFRSDKLRAITNSFYLLLPSGHLLYPTSNFDHKRKGNTKLCSCSWFQSFAYLDPTSFLIFRAITNSFYHLPLIRTLTISNISSNTEGKERKHKTLQLHGRGGSAC